jgi:hypothetical protein
MILLLVLAAAAPLQNPEIKRLTDGAHHQYYVFGNANGVLLKSRSNRIYLGKDCDAYSPGYGRGHWSWANGGVLVEFKKGTFGFPRQDTPFNDLRCMFQPN